MKKMEQSLEDNIVIDLKIYKKVLTEWKEKECNLHHIHPVSAMLEEMGLELVRLTSGGRNVLFKISNPKSFLLAKIKYNF